MRIRINPICVICLIGAVFFYTAGYMSCLARSWPYAGLSALLCAACSVFFTAEWRRDRYLSMSLRKIDKMSGLSFEQYLQTHFKKMGYKVKMTEATGDYGADLVLTKRGETTVVQAKRYSKSVGVAAVQEVIGAMAYYEADRAMVVTNMRFTRNAKNLAEQSNVELWDRDRLKKEFGAKE